jgi:hypothetical protein
MVFPIPTSAFQNDEDDDEDSWLDETIMFLLLAFAGVYSIFFGQVIDPIQRAPPVAEQRLNWEAHRDLEVSRGLFRCLYRMELEDFELLISLLRESLEVNKVRL